MRIAAVTMQKDETELLSFWAAYHGKLFGYENLTVFDNGSKNLETLRILDDLGRLGVRILDRSGTHDFERKGIIVSELIESERDNFDWVFPMDIDELVIIEADGRLSSMREDIFEELARAASEGKPVLRISQSYWNIPQSTGAYPLPLRKTIVRTGSGIRLDMGYHLYSWDTNAPTIDSSNFAETRIGYVHLHNRFFADLLSAARQKLRLRVSDYSANTLMVYRGAGRHLCKYFDISEEKYYGSFPAAKFDLNDVEIAARRELPFSSRAPAFTDELKHVLYAPLNLDAPQWAAISADNKDVLQLMMPHHRLFEYGLSDLSLAATETGFRVSGIELLADDKNRSRLLNAGVGIVGDAIPDPGLPPHQVTARHYDAVLQHVSLARSSDVAVIDGPYSSAIAAALYLSENPPIAIWKTSCPDSEKELVAAFFKVVKMNDSFSRLEIIPGRLFQAGMVLAFRCSHQPDDIS